MKNKLFKYCLAILLGIFISIGTPTATHAQCPMCKMSAEQNLKDGGTAGKGLNQGILYMFVMPYILVGCIGYVWYRNKLSDEDHEIAEALQQ